jgi:hypothetical protein
MKRALMAASAPACLQTRLIRAAFGILISLSGIASLWAFRKIARLAS